MIYFGFFLTTKVLLFGIILILIQNFSYLHTALANPGLATYETRINYYETNRRYCNHCKIVVDHSNTYHCSHCDICILNHDHHCPWIGKCIGGKTLVSFYIFIISTLALFMYFFLALVFSGKI